MASGPLKIDPVAPGKILHELIELQFGSVRAFAKALAGEGATPEEVENTRTKVQRWTGGRHALTLKSAERLAKPLKVPVQMILAPYRELQQAEQFRRELERIRTGLSEAESRLDGGGSSPRRRGGS